MPIDISTAKRAATPGAQPKPIAGPRSVVLSTEDPAAWRQLLISYMNRFQPADAVEAQLVEQMAAAQWRIRRAWAIESSTYDLELTRSETTVRQTFEAIDAPGRTALAHQHLADNSQALSNIQRQEARLSREYHRALAELRRLQAERPTLEPEPAPLEKANLQNELPHESVPEPPPTPPDHTASEPPAPAQPPSTAPSDPPPGPPPSPQPPSAPPDHTAPE